MNFNEGQLREITRDVKKHTALKNLCFVGRPDRITPIGKDDITNLKIALNVELVGSKKSLNSFFKMV